MTTIAKPSFNMNRYLRLVRRFPLVRIESDGHHDRALQVMDELLDIELKRPHNAEEDAYLGVLTDLIHAYDELTCKEEPVGDDAMLEHLLDSKGATQAELARGAGIAESTVSEVLHGKRKLTRKQIGKVADFFNVRPELFDPRG